jgi:O-antigen ligase
MYIGLSVLLIVNKIILITNDENFKKNQLVIQLTLLSIFLFFIALLSSKAGIIILFLMLIFLTIKEVFRKKYTLLIYFFSLLIIMVITIFSNSNATTTMRFKDAKNELTLTQTKEPEKKVGSSDTRIEVWKASLQLIKNKTFLGTGTGDIKDELIKQYTKNNFVLGIQNQYNCHNQYLQFILIFGIVGGLIFPILLILSIKYGIQTKNHLFVQFLVLICLNVLIESMLESKAGVEFYAFFLPFFMQNNAEKEI